MAWLIIDPVVLATSKTGQQYFPWYITEGKTVIIPGFFEMSIHGDFIVDGQLILEENARLALET